MCLMSLCVQLQSLQHVSSRIFDVRKEECHPWQEKRWERNRKKLVVKGDEGELKDFFFFFFSFEYNFWYCILSWDLSCLSPSFFTFTILFFFFLFTWESFMLKFVLCLFSFSLPPKLKGCKERGTHHIHMHLRESLSFLPSLHFFFKELLFLSVNRDSWVRKRDSNGVTTTAKVVEGLTTGDIMQMHSLMWN